MAKLWSLLRGRKPTEQRLTMNDWAEMWVKYQGQSYMPVGSMQRSGPYESINEDFEGLIAGCYKSDGIVFACMLARMSVFSEARFQFQRIKNGRPQELFGNSDLAILETPWPNGTTGELLARAIQDVDLAGNFYVVNEGKRLRRLRPDWVEILLTADPTKATQSDVEGYVYKPGGPTSDPSSWEIYPIDGKNGKVAHWAPVPDPSAQYRGMSWLTPVIREIMSDKAATLHKSKFFENAATPNLAVTFSDQLTIEQFKDFMEAMDSAKGGVEHAYETLYLGGGADVTVVGSDLRQLDFKNTQGAGETRIAAAAGVHPVVVGLSEGMQGSSLNAGNFKAAKDGFGDKTLRPLWRSFAASIQPILRVPPGARLWYDDRDIAFLRTDRKELADIQHQQAVTITNLVMNGFTPESSRDAVIKEDFSILEHTGLFSVQLLPPNTVQPTAADASATEKPGGAKAPTDKPGAKPTDGKATDAKKPAKPADGSEKK